MRILVIGGTRFVGRAFVEDAVARGHDVTVFHRGTDPDDFPDVEHIHGNRDGGLDALRGGEWDAVLDTCAYVPRQVRELADVLKSAAGHYTIVSSLSVHPDDVPAGGTERSPVHQAPFPDTEEVDGETYGPLKVACEVEARAAFGERCMIIRPGYIVGPHDPTDRFTWWLRRASEGGQMAVPEPQDAPMQAVDVRDLAAFMLDRIEAGDGETYGVVGPGEQMTTRDVVQTAKDVTGSDVTFTWVPQGRLDPFGEQVFGWFPMWHPMYPGVHAYDPSKAVAAGLRHRPLATTIADTIAWDRARGLPPMRAGLPAEHERELIGS